MEPVKSEAIVNLHNKDASVSFNCLATEINLVEKKFHGITTVFIDAIINSKEDLLKLSKQLETFALSFEEEEEI
jgi:hypothetical protein